MRQFAIFLLSGGFLVLGVCAARDLKCCVRDLREVIVGIQTIKRELKHSLAPLPDLFQFASAQTVGEVKLLFADCAYRIEATRTETFNHIWEQALARRKFNFKQSDYSILTQLGSVLGRYDVDEQLNALERTIELLEQRCVQATEESGRMGRVYTVLGFASGMSVLLLLL